ncbi:MAG: hypothetical protein HZC28_08820 [Spirochaetes bacterium]|nr:hypothetical protein [Spirochaetota bacterium]
MSASIIWAENKTAPELNRLLRSLGEEYPVYPHAHSNAAEGEVSVIFQNIGDMNGYEIERSVSSSAVVRYGRLRDAARATGSLLAGMHAGSTVRETCAFTELGMLLDCGHNAVVTAAQIRKWLRHLALLGFDTAMIYTDTGYRLPGEPAFGYMHGAYTFEEMRDLDSYAVDLGIELVASIQALGHLEQALKWAPYQHLRDTEHILLVGDPKTEALIEKMIAFWSSALRSRRIHLGMDETYDLGRGRYQDVHGHRAGLDIYVEHLSMVARICRRYGIKPLAWSDVLFRFAGNADQHYGSGSRIPDGIRKQIPGDLDLVYWDYYNSDEVHYTERIEKHRELGYEPIVASGVWTWPTFWHDWTRTERFAVPCIKACRQSGIKRLHFTLWSDDGGFWALDSAFAGLAYVAEHCYNDSVDMDCLARRFNAVTGSDLAAHRCASAINDPLAVCSVMWDDPLLNIYLRHVDNEDGSRLSKSAAAYAETAQSLESVSGDRAAGDLGHAALVARVLAQKTGLAARLFQAWNKKERQDIEAVRALIPPLVTDLEALAASFRRQWLSTCKPFGLEVLQIRFAGLAARYRELDLRLNEFAEEKIREIPELDEHLQGVFLPARHNTYRGLATGARIF